MSKINIQYYKSNLGELIIGSFDDKLCLLDWSYNAKRILIDNRITKFLNAKFVEEDSVIIQQTIVQLNEYFNQKRNFFDVPLLLIGTVFQKKVWKELINIPYGNTSTYTKLALSIDNKKAVRAVANTTAGNAIAIIVPCHRIIGSNGKLTGYAGGLSQKQQLLTLEHE